MCYKFLFDVKQPFGILFITQERSMEMFLIFLAYCLASFRTEPHMHEIFAKFNHFRSAVFLQNSSVPAVPREKLWLCRRKYCKQKSIKFGGNVAFLCDLAHSFTTNAKQDKIRSLSVVTLKCLWSEKLFFLFWKALVSKNRRMEFFFLKYVFSF